MRGGRHIMFYLGGYGFVFHHSTQGFIQHFLEKRGKPSVAGAILGGFQKPVN